MDMEFIMSIGRFIATIYFLAPLTIFLTPLRWAFDFFTLYHPDLFRRRNTPENHNRKVKDVQNQVLEWIRNGRKSKMCTARPGWQTMPFRQLDKSGMTQIKIDHLEDIVEIDTEKKVLRVEPGMKMGTLIYKLEKLGWTIPVVPGLETLTIGGLVNGTGLETSSHKYGLFAYTCVEFEVVIGDGLVVRCSNEENSELYYAIPMSHGTIGFLTEVSIPIVAMPKYVRVEYIPVVSIEEMERRLYEPDRDFVEGILFNRNRSVVIFGTLKDKVEKGAKINHINRWYKRFFFSHVERYLREQRTIIEYIPTRDYYFRHQRGYFWETSSIVPLFNNEVFLYFFGWMHPINFQLKKLITPKFLNDILIMKKHIRQDFIIPMKKLGDLIKLSHKEIELISLVYPLWLCPVKTFRQPGMMGHSFTAGDLHVDVGIFGNIGRKFDYKTISKKFEKFCIDNHGFQRTYTDSYLSREEFRQMFNILLYDLVRKDLESDVAFPDVYDKVSLPARM